MSEWLDLMLEEIARKRREALEAEAEQRRREESLSETRAADEPAQSK